MSEFFDRLKQRKLIQWAVAYLAGGWVLLQVIDLVGGKFGWPDAVGRAAIVIVGIGFLAVLVLAWYHGEQGRQRATGIELLLLTAVLLLAGSAAFWVARKQDKATTGSDAAGNVDAKSIAVLPFKTFTSDEESRAFAGGIHDEVLTQLSKIGALQVRSRTSVQQYKDTEKPIRDIARELSVATILEGSVQRSGNQVRVQAQLIDPATDAHLWAENYTGNFSQVFAFQSDIAQKIAEALSAQLTAQERTLLTRLPTSSPEAYDLYMNGRSYQLRPDAIKPNLESAERLFQRALRLDPDFALAHAWLSVVHSRMLWYGHDASEARKKAMYDEAKAALRLQPDLPESLIAMGYAHYYGERAYDDALREFRTALQSSPSSSDIVSAVGFVLRRQGKWAESIEAMNRALELDPRNTATMRDLGDAYSFTGKFEEGIRIYNRALALAPDYYTVASQKGWTYARYSGQLDTLRAVVASVRSETGGASSPAYDRFQLAALDRDFAAAAAAASEAPALINVQIQILPRSLLSGWAAQWNGRPARAAFDSARAVFERELRARPNDIRLHLGIAFAYAGLGQKQDAIRHLNLTQALPDFAKDELFRPVYGRDIARVYAQLGDVDAALAHINQSMKSLVFITKHTLRLDPFFDPIRKDPRFQALVQ